MKVNYFRFVDIFGRTLPSWVKHHLREADSVVDSSSSDGFALLSHAQRNQLSIYGSLSNLNKPVLTHALAVCPQQYLDIGPACVVHTRRHRYISFHAGDIVTDVDLQSPFLSPRGEALTADAGEILKLSLLSSKRGYLNPFWLSEADAYCFSAHYSIAKMLDIRPHNIYTVFKKMSEIGNTVRISNDRRGQSQVVNISELQETDTISRNLFSAFRRFQPVNVVSTERFDACIEDCLRMESILSRRWCSVWGTIKDFQMCGFEVLDGALGLHVLDEHGNEMFITNAFCTTDPIGVFAKVYPSNFIVSAIISMEHPSLEAARLKLLLELSALRERYTQLTGEHLVHGNASPLLENSSSEDSQHLAQSDRDAIEAFFNSDDDFTRLFNQGDGRLKRADILGKVVGDSNEE